MTTRMGVTSLIVLFVVWSPASLHAQSDSNGSTEGLSARVTVLSHRIERLEDRVHGNEPAGAGFSFVCGIICALWAQNTGRNAWLWFFLGLLFSVITVLVLLWKNSQDPRRWTPNASPVGGPRQ